MPNQRKEWRRDIEDRQRGIVFPDTARNEARFWRNLADGPWKASTLIGMTVLAIFVFTGLAVFVVASFESGLITGLTLIVGTLFFAGLLFAAIRWGTRRALRDIRTSRTKREH